MCDGLCAECWLVFACERSFWIAVEAENNVTETDDDPLKDGINGPNGQIE